MDMQNVYHIHTIYRSALLSCVSYDDAGCNVMSCDYGIEIYQRFYGVVTLSDDKNWVV